MSKQNGYVIDTTYPVFFYKEMQPLWLKTIVSFLGFETPEINKDFSYLELGCATGINLLVSAINYPRAHFVGVDFNQQHIEKAKQLANSLGLQNIKFIHSDFANFLEENTQKFDFIVNHGTFSWISEQHQQNILDIVAKSLNDKGLFYLHYMCYPGSAHLQPVQKLLHLVDTQTQDSSLDSIEVGKKLFFDLNEAGAFIDHKNINPILNVFKNNNAYLAHEFLTNHWQPLYSVDVHEQVFQTSELNYLGSANSIENMESLSIPTNLQSIVANIKAPALKEYVKDLARNTKQRTDIFQKKPKSLNNLEHIEAINRIRFKLLPAAPQNGNVIFRTSIGDIKASNEVILPMFKSMQKKDRSFEELLGLPTFKNNPLFLIETIFLAMHAGYLHPVSEIANTQTQSLAEKLDRIMQKDEIKFKNFYECATAF